MLNYLWGFMIVIGILYAAFTGNFTAVTNAALDSSKEAVTLHPKALRPAALNIREGRGGVKLWALKEPANSKVFVCDSCYFTGRICTHIPADMVDIATEFDEI